MSHPPRPMVLVVDPDALTLMGLSATLHHQQLEVHGARTPKSALQAAADLALDLVLIDRWVADDGGLNLLASIRQLPHLVDLPAILLLEAADTHLPLPISSFRLIKPIDLDALASIVQRALWLPHLVHDPVTFKVPDSHFQTRPAGLRT